MIFQPNRLQQKNFAQLKNTSEYAKMVSGFSITPVCLSKYLCQSCQRRNKNQDHRREPKTHFWSILYFKKTIYTFSYFRYGRGGTFPGNSLQPSDTIVFQGIGYATVQYSLQELKRHPAFTMQELQYNLQEATATGISPKEILKKAIE